MLKGEKQDGRERPALERMFGMSEPSARSITAASLV